MNCKTNGHDWQHTTSDLMQRCLTCKKKRQKINGQWFLVEPAKQGPKPKEVPQEQLRLW